MARLPHFLTPLRANPGAVLAVAGGAVVAPRIEAAFESATRRRGLLGRDLMPVDTAVVIAPTSAIHTIGMRFAIDVLFVARDGTVIKLCPSLRPWRLAAAWRAFAAIEVAAGTAARLDLRPGHRLEVRGGAMPA